MEHKIQLYNPNSHYSNPTLNRTTWFMSIGIQDHVLTVVERFSVAQSNSKVSFRTTVSSNTDFPTYSPEKDCQRFAKLLKRSKQLSTYKKD